MLQQDPIVESPEQGSWAGSRFNNNEMQGHLARMGRQLAEIEAQHLQFIVGKKPDRENLAKATARYLNGLHQSSIDSGDEHEDICNTKRDMQQSAFSSSRAKRFASESNISGHGLVAEHSAPAVGSAASFGAPIQPSNSSAGGHVNAAAPNAGERAKQQQQWAAAAAARRHAILHAYAARTSPPGSSLSQRRHTSGSAAAAAPYISPQSQAPRTTSSNGSPQNGAQASPELPGNPDSRKRSSDGAPSMDRELSTAGRVSGQGQRQAVGMRKRSISSPNGSSPEPSPGMSPSQHQSSDALQKQGAVLHQAGKVDALGMAMTEGVRYAVDDGNLSETHAPPSGVRVYQFHSDEDDSDVVSCEVETVSSEDAFEAADNLAEEEQQQQQQQAMQAGSQASPAGAWQQQQQDGSEGVPEEPMHVPSKEDMELTFGPNSSFATSISIQELLQASVSSALARTVDEDELGQPAPAGRLLLASHPLDSGVIAVEADGGSLSSGMQRQGQQQQQQQHVDRLRLPPRQPNTQPAPQQQQGRSHMAAALNHASPDSDAEPAYSPAYRRRPGSAFAASPGGGPLGPAGEDSVLYGSPIRQLSGSQVAGSPEVALSPGSFQVASSQATDDDEADPDVWSPVAPRYLRLEQQQQQGHASGAADADAEVAEDGGSPVMPPRLSQRQGTSPVEDYAMQQGFGYFSATSPLRLTGLVAPEWDPAAGAAGQAPVPAAAAAAGAARSRSYFPEVTTLVYSPERYADGSSEDEGYSPSSSPSYSPLPAMPHQHGNASNVKSGLGQGDWGNLTNDSSLAAAAAAAASASLSSAGSRRTAEEHSSQHHHHHHHHHYHYQEQQQPQQHGALQQEPSVGAAHAASMELLPSASAAGPSPSSPRYSLLQQQRSADLIDGSEQDSGVVHHQGVPQQEAGQQLHSQQDWEHSDAVLSQAWEQQQHQARQHSKAQSYTNQQQQQGSSDMPYQLYSITPDTERRHESGNEQLSKSAVGDSGTLADAGRRRDAALADDSYSSSPGQPPPPVIPAADTRTAMQISGTVAEFLSQAAEAPRSVSQPRTAGASLSLATPAAALPHAAPVAGTPTEAGSRSPPKVALQPPASPDDALARFARLKERRQQQWQQQHAALPNTPQHKGLTLPHDMQHASVLPVQDASAAAARTSASPPAAVPAMPSPGASVQQPAEATSSRVTQPALSSAPKTSHAFATVEPVSPIPASASASPVQAPVSTDLSRSPSFTSPTRQHASSTTSTPSHATRPAASEHACSPSPSSPPRQSVRSSSSSSPARRAGASASASAELAAGTRSPSPSSLARRSTASLSGSPTRLSPSSSMELLLHEPSAAHSRRRRSSSSTLQTSVDAAAAAAAAPAYPSQPQALPAAVAGPSGTRPAAAVGSSAMPSAATAPGTHRAPGLLLPFSGDLSLGHGIAGMSQDLSQLAQQYQQHQHQQHAFDDGYSGSPYTSVASSNAHASSHSSWAWMGLPAAGHLGLPVTDAAAAAAAASASPGTAAGGSPLPGTGLGGSGHGSIVWGVPVVGLPVSAAITVIPGNAHSAEASDHHVSTPPAMAQGSRQTWTSGAVVAGSGARQSLTESWGPMSSRSDAWDSPADAGQQIRDSAVALGSDASGGESSRRRRSSGDRLIVLSPAVGYSQAAGSTRSSADAKPGSTSNGRGNSADDTSWQSPSRKSNTGQQKEKQQGSYITSPNRSTRGPVPPPSSTSAQHQREQHQAGSSLQHLQQAGSSSSTIAGHQSSVNEQQQGDNSQQQQQQQEPKASRLAALLRLKQQQQKLREQVSQSAGVVGHDQQVQPGLQQELHGDVHDEPNQNFSLRRNGQAAAATPMARLPAAAAAAAESINQLPRQEAARSWAREAEQEPEEQQQQQDTTAAAAAAAKPFLKRRSKAVVSKKVDWSYVKPRTVTSRPGEEQHHDEEQHQQPRLAQSKQPKQQRQQQQQQQRQPLASLQPAPNSRIAKPPLVASSQGAAARSRQAAAVSPHRPAGNRLAAARRSVASWRPGGKQPTSPPGRPSGEQGAKAFGAIGASSGRDTAGGIPGLDYDVQRVTSTYRPSGDYHLTGIKAAAATPVARAARGAGGRVAGGPPAGSTSPLDDLLNHVNSLLKDFDTMMVPRS